MDEQAVDQRQDDVTAFLDQIESKMGKPTIDGLVSKLKMKPPKFISILKETVVTQVTWNGSSLHIRFRHLFSFPIFSLILMVTEIGRQRRSSTCCIF